MLVVSFAFADCKVVQGGKSLPFDGTKIQGLLIEKKSLIPLNKEFPNLNIIERVFKGEVQTCSDCSGQAEKYVVCHL